MSAWQDIRSGKVPINETVIVGNLKTGDVFPAYAYWGEAPFPMWCSLHPDGMGRCKPTHWQPMPAISPALVLQHDRMEVSA